MTIRLITLAALVACTGIKTHPGLPDAPPDQRIDTPVAMLTPHHYIIDKQNTATNNTEARAQGLDLNNDGTVDNQLGMVVAAFVEQGIGDVQTSLHTAV